MIRKHFSTLFVVALMLTLLTGCRGNVSHREDGMITDPTDNRATAATMPTVATMPSTDTVPMDTIATEPSETTDATNASDASEENGQKNTAKQTQPRDFMGRD